MRFDQWNLTAFGPFTDFTLDFPRGEVDLHILYGPNEAGKSSLLRAVRQMLFGIAARSEDDFLHEYRKLRAGATLTNRDGTSLQFFRKKAQQQTLRDAADQPLPDHALLPFLGAVNEAYFTNMFGLTADQLRTGAKTLLKGEGDLGKALFSASLGGTPVQRIIESLQADADKIFKPLARGGTSLNAALETFGTLKRSLSEKQLKPEAWAELEQKIARATERCEELQAATISLRTRMDWLQRCQDALPTISQLQEAAQQLTAFAHLPEVSENFLPEAREAQKNALEREAEVVRLELEIVGLQNQLEQSVPPAEVLHLAPQIDELARHEASAQEKEIEQVALHQRVASTEREMHTRLRDLGLNEDFANIERLRLTTAQRLACESVAKSLESSREAVGRLHQQLLKLQTQAASQEQVLTAGTQGDPEALQLALSEAQPALGAQTTLEEARKKFAKIERLLGQTQILLHDAPAQIKGVLSLPVPGIATMERYEKLFTSLQQQHDALVRERSTIQTELLQAQSALARMELSGRLPSLVSLQNARGERDAVWLALAETLGEGGHPEPGVLTEYPALVASADHLADRLREEANAVAEAEKWRDQCAASSEKLATLDAEIQTHATDLQRAREAWENEWRECHFIPKSPREMLEWRLHWVKFSEYAEELTMERLRMEEAENTIATATDRIRTSLGSASAGGFGSMLDLLQRRISLENKQEGERKTLAAAHRASLDEAAQLQSQLRQLEQELQTRQSQWDDQLKALSLKSDTTPEHGLALLSARVELLHTHEIWGRDRARMTTIDAALQERMATINQLAQALNIEAPSPETRLAALIQAANDARKTNILHESLAGRLHDAQVAVRQAHRAADQAADALGEIYKLACTTDRSGLESSLAACEQRQQLRQQVAGFRRSLHGLARGEALEPFINRVLASEPASLPTLQAEVSIAFEQKERDRRSAESDLVELQQQKSALEKADGGAAEISQQLALQTSAIQADAARYTRLSLALSLLKSQVEAFRRHHQGPMLDRASSIFSQLTDGAFLGLTSEWQAEDSPPKLVGVRKDSQSVPPEGMSEGTQDQLYLSLRLAALELYLESHEPMPLILDDLLITYDDARAAALLRQLTSTARLTQVIVFTHHRHLRELCEETLGKGQFCWRSLEGR